MMNLLSILSKGLLFIFLSVSLHLTVAYVFPFPYHTANSIIAMCVLYLFWKQQGNVVWLAFFSFLFIELYTAQPFGFHIAAGTLGTLISYWISRYILTQRSWYSLLAIAAAASIAYRVLYLACLLVFHVFIDTLILPPAKTILTLYTIELGMTASLVMLLFFLSYPFKNRFLSNTRLSSL